MGRNRGVALALIYSELKINFSHFGLDLPVLKEIGSLGFVTLARQAVVSITY